MSAVKRLLQAARQILRPSPADRCAGQLIGETYPPEVADIAGLLAMPIMPRPQFVESLELALVSRLVPAVHGGAPTPMASSDRTGFRWRRLAGLAGFAVLVLVVVSVLSISTRTDEDPKFASALVLSDAVEKLFDVRTVRYETRTEVQHGICFTGYKTPFTAGEIATVEARGETTDGTGVVYGCENTPQVVTEKGVYDLANREFYGVFTRSESGLLPVDSGQVQERMYVGGMLYTKTAGQDWTPSPPGAARWAPFSFGGFGQVPAGDLNFLRSQYDKIEIVGTEVIEGEKITHYRASRTGTFGPESVEAWIGVDDGLPRKAVVRTESEMSDEIDELDRVREIQASSPNVPDERRNDPIVRRGPWPEKRVITYTYMFRDFNEPVEITAP